jgi:hypothetical protein
MTDIYDSISEQAIHNFRPQEVNANRHSPRGEGMLEESLQKVGWIGAATCAADGEMFDGSLRLEKIATVFDGVNPIVVDTDGTRPVILRRTDIATANDPKARLASVYANRVAEVSLNWDTEVLEQWNEEGSIDVDTMWFPEEMAAWDMECDSGYEQPSAEEDEETASDLIEQAEDGKIEPRFNLGDIIALGRHRIACGDSTDESNVRKLLGNFSIGCLMFDPPWDAGIKLAQFSKYCDCYFVFCDGNRFSDVDFATGTAMWLFTWDCVSCWYTPNRPLKRAKYCVWMGVGDIQYNFNGAHYGDPSETRTVWNTRGSYEFNPDPRGKHLADVFSSPITKLHSESQHSQSKPVDWIKMIVANCSNGNIFDPFLGSGTTIIAAEKIEGDRTVYGFELSPEYIEVICRRWESFTGGVAELAGHL